MGVWQNKRGVLVWPTLALSAMLWLVTGFCRPGLALAKQSSRSVCGEWRQRLQVRRLLLSARERAVLLRQALGSKRPLPNLRRRALIAGYHVILKEVVKVRRCFRRRLRVARTKSSRRRLLSSVAVTLQEVLEEAVLPLWVGTAWDFYGTAERPHQKKLACGYFVVHALQGVGFRFPENFVFRSKTRGAMRIFSFAKQSAGVMAKLLSRRGLIHVSSSASTAVLRAPLQRHGPGLYLLGLSNHVGLVLYDGRHAHFWHSAYGDAAWVKRENLFTSPVVVASRYRMLAKFSVASFWKWSLGRGIRVRRRRR